MTEFEFEQERSHGTNRSAPATTCATCGGDRFVVYSLRPVVASTWMREHDINPQGQTIEEYAACPDCGPELGPRHPDPAQVRERLAQ